MIALDLARRAVVSGLLLAALGQTALAAGMSMPGSDTPAHAAPPHGARIPVKFPPQLRREVLATMRMHLQGLAGIQQALADGRYDEAAQVASMALGMSSMHGDQASEEARYMPPGMLALGRQLHMQAGAFALAAQDATATGDSRKPQQLLGQMMQTCVDCHAAYRLQ